MSSKSEHSQDLNKIRMSFYKRPIYFLKNSLEFLKYKLHMLLLNMER